jgi:hypothetical protein
VVNLEAIKACLANDKFGSSDRLRHALIHTDEDGNRWTMATNGHVGVVVRGEHMPSPLLMKDEAITRSLMAMTFRSAEAKRTTIADLRAFAGPDVPVPKCSRCDGKGKVTGATHTCDCEYCEVTDDEELECEYCEGGEGRFDPNDNAWPEHMTSIDGAMVHPFWLRLVLAVFPDDATIEFKAKFDSAEKRMGTIVFWSEDVRAVSVWYKDQRAGDAHVFEGWLV